MAASLDVAAHELSHGVIQYTANLTYQNESGALNESFANIFAILIERKNYAIGEDVVNTSVCPSGVLRSLSNPNNGGTRLGDPGWQPSSVSQQYFGSEDEGGVHINSGIPNHAFYLFSSDSRVGVNVAEAAYFKALRDYLTASSNFKALRRAIGQSIVDLYGNDADILAAFNEAFDAVGIEASSTNEPEPDPEVVYEVNPGEDFIVWYNKETQEINIRFLSTGADQVISQKGLLNNPSISDDGRLLLFIGTDRKLYAVIFVWQSPSFSFNEVLLDQREWRNVAISRDGEKIAALLGNLGNNDFDNQLLIIDLISETEKFFTLTNPTTAQGVSTSNVQYADAIKWDHTIEYVMYDASNSVVRLFNDPINYWDIGFIKVWNNANQNYDEGSIFKLFPSLPENVSIRNPSFSNLSSDRIVLDVLDTNDEEIQYTILGVNLETNDQAIIFDQGNVPGYPNYSRTDEEVIFNFNNNGTFGPVTIVATRSIATDGITGIGDATVKINEATWGTWMSNGQRDLSTSTIDQELSQSIILYPNPAENFIFLNHEDIDCQSCNLEVFDLSGRALKHSNYSNGNRIDLSNIRANAPKLCYQYI
ncbi:MAG: bacillolysin [Saprospiraceae bacterium]